MKINQYGVLFQPSLIRNLKHSMSFNCHYTFGIGAHINNPLRIGRSSEVVRSVVIVVGALTLIECLIVAAAKETPGTQDVSIAGTFPNPHWEVARQLTLLGIQAGDRVAVVGNHLPYFWARLARVKIVSEVLLTDPACGGVGCEAESTARWLKVKDALAATGAKVLVSPCVHGVVDQPGWAELGGTGVFAYKF
jgi:hypothetical protein